MQQSFLLLSCWLLCYSSLIAQEASKDEDAFFIRSIYDSVLSSGQSYHWLKDLSCQGGRLSGSPGAAAGVEYTRQMLDTLGLDSVWLQDCMVPHWIRGDKEAVRIVNSSIVGSIDLNGLALGNSVGTGNKGITATVIEVQSLDEVEELGKAKIEGKIVFYNRPMDNRQIRTFHAYGGAVDQRVYGASKAAQYGAVGVLVRSMTTRLDDIPHTGVLVYKDSIPQIPAIAISTNDAELLSGVLKDEAVNVYMRSTCQILEKKKSYNVIGEIYGSEKPDEIILVGGHLDAWDVGSGAHDDGAGCVHAMDVLQTLKRLDYHPKRTIRCVLFMNEENGQAGAQAYADASNAKGEFHLGAIESDSGGFLPIGFSCDSEEDIFIKNFKKISEWQPLLEPYGINFVKGGSGADVSYLKKQGGFLFGLRTNSQRYFDYHHTALDQIEAVNQRELELGVGAMTSLVYLLDKYFEVEH